MKLWRRKASGPLKIALELGNANADRLPVRVTLSNAGEMPIAVVSPLGSDPVPFERRVPQMKIRPPDALGVRPEPRRLEQWREGDTLHLGLVYRDDRHAFWTRMEPGTRFRLDYAVSLSKVPASEPPARVVFHAQYTESPDFLKVFDDWHHVKVREEGGSKFKVSLHSLPRLRKMEEASSEPRSVPG